MTELSEQQIQNKVIKWAKQRAYGNGVLLDHITHVPNGGKRSKRVAAGLKHGGVKKGYPDLIIDIASGEYHGLRIELKKLSDGVVSDEQEQCLQTLREQGYRAEVCKGFDAAINEIKDYLGIK